ncbi:EAL domain-containing protein [Proteobacteria bacterium 005FR1]|nr:EAL domain-containing protein [Proteobacteria bacterium 005FR1]
MRTSPCTGRKKGKESAGSLSGHHACSAGAAPHRANDLRGAISKRELIPYFQPKIDAQRSRVTGCEVLVRWRHPKHGFLSPAQFVPFAEENGPVRVMDHYILEQACRRARRWQDEYGYSIPVAVNLSGVHFRDRQIVDVVGAVLARERLDPRLLDIELTEAVFIGDPAVALETLTELKRLGVSVSLDDFGIGYSSLHYLRTLPVDVVKLDKSFIQNLTVSKQDRQLTRGIISLASELGFEVVAEGVETGEQVDALLELNCPLMQGYHFCKPGPEEEFLTWIGDKQVHGFDVTHVPSEQ